MYISELLEAMRYDGHVIVRKQTSNGLEFRGGGSSMDVSFRFGGMPVKRTTIVDGVLVIIV